jgi:hypothetical protein
MVKRYFHPIFLSKKASGCAVRCFGEVTQQLFDGPFGGWHRRRLVEHYNDLPELLLLKGRRELNPVPGLPGPGGHCGQLLQGFGRVAGAIVSQQVENGALTSDGCREGGQPMRSGFHGSGNKSPHIRRIFHQQYDELLCEFLLLK